VYVDQATGYAYIHLQKSVSEAETLSGKITLEQLCNRYNIKVSAYHEDDEMLAATSWKKECINNGQALTFTGAEAYHQNGISERRIQTLQDRARTIVSHSFS
jgi:hypothetical protein